ncbi:MAG TPA: chromosomal replication initiator protein DnaA [Candidatus Kapabacteria bacterium]|nr:chromosomal replication initiator protein DnaA [Candidatus Kapabacteria bacterium]
MEELITESKTNITNSTQNGHLHLASTWSKALEIFRDNVDNSAFKIWFEQIEPVSLQNNKIVLRVPSQFFYEWLEEHYSRLISSTLERLLNKEIEIFYEIRQTVKNSSNDRTNTTQKFKSQKNDKMINNNSDPINNTLHKDYNFSNFVMGESNHIAVKTAKSIALNPLKTRYNPFLIYGNTGLGKTHLIHSIGNEIVKNFPNMSVLYLTGEQYFINYTNAVTSNKVNEFSEIYRNVDVLIIDDIQFLAGKEKTQDHFFHTFNSLYQAKKLIIFTSDKSTKELRGIDHRLISRFNSGVTVDIQPPDFEMRTQILKMKSLLDGFELPEDVTNYLAKNVTDSIRELEGAYINLLARSTLNHKPITMDLAREVVKSIYQMDNREMTLENIRQIVANYFQLTCEEMLSKSRKQELVIARQLSMYFVKKYMNIPLKKIAEAFGTKDHTSVVYAIKKVNQYLQFDKSFRKSFETIENIISREFGIEDNLK